MKKLLTGLVLGAMLMSPQPASAGDDNGTSDTTVNVRRVTQIVGNRSSVTLAWGSATFPITVKTNASGGYHVTVIPVSLTGGVGVSLANVKVSISGAKGCWRTAREFGRETRTSASGDTAWVTISVWQPLGSPKVSLIYKLETFK